MTLTVTHQFVSGVADDPTAAAAGEVLPSHWNAQHVVSGVALQVATSNQTFYVATTGSDSNDGSSARPFATIQHAISVALSFDYQSLYTATVQAAAGTYQENVSMQPIFQGFQTGTVGGLTLNGDHTTPTNCKIAPNFASGHGTNNAVMTMQGQGVMAVDGFSFVADDTAPGPTTIFQVSDCFFAGLRRIDFDTGTAGNYLFWLIVDTFARADNGGTDNWTFHNTGGTSFAIMQCSNHSTLVLQNLLIFQSAVNLAGATFFVGDAFAKLRFQGTTFTNPGNITNGNPVGLTNETALLLGVDPVTITWPGGTFDPSQIDGSSTVDGFYYPRKYSGPPVDESSIYRGSWQVHKDTSQATGKGIAVWADDAGTLVNLTDIVINTTPIDGGTDQRLLFDSDGVVSETAQVTYDDVANQLLVPNGSVVAGNAPGLTFAANSGTGLAANSANLAFWENATIACNLSTVLKQFRIPSNFVYSWSSATNNNSAADTGLGRADVNVVEINNGTQGSGPGVLKLLGSTVGGLPGSPAAGEVAYVTDGTTGLTFGNTVTGGHATKYLVWYNGTNWTVIGA